MPTVVEKIRLLPPGPDNQRNSEGAFATLADGRLLLAYSRFTGGDHDDSSSDLRGRYSRDGGRTWTTEDVLLVPNPDLNAMSVSLLRLTDGRLAMFYLARMRQEGQQQRLDPLVRFSSDEAATWSEPVCCRHAPSYYVVNNDRVIQLADGRLVVPAADHGHFDGSRIGVGRPVCFLSDDQGQTWRPSAYVVMPADQEQEHLQEPGLVQLRDGRLMMLCRTTLGCQYRAWSADGGETWSVAEPTDLISPCSPATVKYLPGTDDLVIVYNDHRHIGPELQGKRTPLVTALSADHGQTWHHRRVLEDDPEGWYCYTAMHFLEDTMVLGYCAGNPVVGGLNLLQVTRVPLAWLYE